MTNSMLEYYNTTLTENFEKKGLKPVEFRILGRIPICFAIGVKFDEKNIEEKDFISEDGWYVFSDMPQCKNKIYHDNGKISKYQEIIGNSEGDKFRKDLLENNTESEFFIEESHGSIQ